MLRPRRLGCSGVRRGVRAATCDVKSGARAATCDVSIGVPVTTSPGAAAAFAGAGADQFALELGKPAEHGQHQAPVRGRRVGPCVMQRTKARALAGDRRQRV
jgi:hypothetical protein